MRSKKRLTITLSPDLVRQVDRLIDKKTVRSRSHAIETLLRERLEPRVSTAVVLAGGPEPQDPIPALCPIGGQPLISGMLRHLAAAGITTAVILAGANEEPIRDLLGSGGGLGLEVRYVSERRPLGTAGALRSVEPHVADGPFLVLHGDVLTNIDLSDFIHFHSSENALATIAVKPRGGEKRYGKVLLQGNRITEFRERSDGKGTSIVNTGVYLFDPAVLGLIGAGKESHLETDVFPRLAEMGELSAFFFQGIWFDISTPESYRAARVRWKTRRS